MKSKTLNIVTWVFQVVLFGMIGMAGFFKLTTRYDILLTTAGMEWTADFTAGQVGLIGLIELVGAMGLLLPYVFKKTRFFIPIAATGIALIMVGAIITHIGRGDAIMLQPIILLIAGFVAFQRRNYLMRSNNQLKTATNV